MKGDARSWFQWMHRNNLLVDWPSFTVALERRFGPSTYFNHEAALFKLRLTSTVANYRRDFEALSNRIYGLAPSTQLNCFISGLPVYMQREMSILKASSLSEAGDIAQLLEDKILDLKSPLPKISIPPIPPSPPLPKASFSFPQLPPPRPSTSQIPQLSAPKQVPSTFPIRRLSPTEMQARRAKGLCFNCDEQYKPGHRCRTTPFLLLQADDDLPDLKSLEAVHSMPLSAVPALPPPQDTIVDDPPDFQVSFHALFGTISYNTLKLSGVLKVQNLTVLVDTGSTHNLIQPRLAKHLNLSIEPAPPFSVSVGNGEQLSCLGRIPSIQLGLQGHEFNLDLYVLDIRGADFILGIQWLSQLGPVIADYKALYMSFYHLGSFITLQGDKPNCPQPVSYGQLKRLVHTDSIADTHFLTMEAISSTAPPSQYLAISSPVFSFLDSLRHYYATSETGQQLLNQGQQDPNMGCEILGVTVFVLTICKTKNE
ncbi:Retrotransposon gag protein [Corchorus olitorius]|uniref:Retrotransposon gag protein n=1 Tax=Corchorus olitorius TaxID=93759 RepID=A0A1R3HDM5_9ROSI|nr:Retrotransposon gag protein [Corchorus olitorius]